MKRIKVMKKFKMVLVNKTPEQIGIDMINGARYWNKDGTLDVYWSNGSFRNDLQRSVNISGPLYEKVELEWQDIVETEYDALTLPRRENWPVCQLNGNWSEEGFIGFCRYVIKAYDEGK